MATFAIYEFSIKPVMGSSQHGHGRIDGMHGSVTTMMACVSSLPVDTLLSKSIIRRYE